jgi:hypothetical protein
MDAIELAESIAAEAELRDRVARDAYERGRADGLREGYARAVADWKVTVGADLGGLAHSELQRRRWGPGGREHFGDPRPGDFTPRSRREAAA